MKKIISLPFFLLLVSFSLNSCKESFVKGQQPAGSVVDSSYVRADCNAVYYWKTRFLLNDDEESFLKKHAVGRMYVRLFDVDLQSDVLKGQDEIVPVGTLVFYEPVPDSVEIVPVVFITVRALEMMEAKQGISSYADKLVTRILNMADFNDLGQVHEIQLDCDWTESTQEAFNRLFREVKALLAGRHILLSSTIRLHQLRQNPPPVDRGVLMLYNTGPVQLASTENSILNERDVKPYLAGKPVHFDLPLDFAYPTYGWGVWFRDGKFSGLLHHTDYSDATRYVPEADGMLRVRAEHVLEGHLLKVGDRIRKESSPYETVAAVKKLVQDAFLDPHHSNILYHLDAQNLFNYSPDEIDSLFAL